MNTLCLIVTSFLETEADITRLFDSLGISDRITVIFVNQSTKDHTHIREKYSRNFCFIEINTNGHIPLSVARNKALWYLYSTQTIDSKTLVLFTDDDAWFPKNTIDYLFSCEINAFTLRVIDPTSNKSFLKYQKKKQGTVRIKDIITDIVSISLIVPFGYLKNNILLFNENLGLGTFISQGEETLFCYQLYILGCRFERLDFFVYHPYKKTFNEHNFYSFTYFLSSFTRYVSQIFKSFLYFYILKYSIAVLLGFIKDKRYFRITKCVYKGFFDGRKDVYAIFK